MNNQEIQELKDLAKKLGELVPAFDWSADADKASELQLAIQQSAELLRTGGFCAERIQLMTRECLRLEKEKGRPILITDSTQDQVDEAVRHWQQQKKILGRRVVDSRFVRQLVRQHFSSSDFRKVTKKAAAQKAAAMVGALTQLVYSMSLCRDNDFSGTKEIVENWLDAHPDQTRKYFCALCLLSPSHRGFENELMVLPMYVLAVWIMADTCLSSQKARDAAGMCQRALDLYLADPACCSRTLDDIQRKVASIFHENVNIVLKEIQQKEKQAKKASLPETASAGLAVRTVSSSDLSSVSSKKEHSNPADLEDNEGPLDEAELKILADALVAQIAIDAPSACQMLRQSLEHTVRDIPRAILFENGFRRRERAAAAESFDRLICGSDGLFEIYCRIVTGYTCSRSICGMEVFPSLLGVQPATIFSRSLAAKSLVGMLSGQKMRPLYPDIEAESIGFNFLSEQLALHLLYSNLWKGEIDGPLLTLMESIEPQLLRLEVPRFLEQDLHNLTPIEKRMKKLTASLLLHSQAVPGFAARLMKMLFLDPASFPEWSAEVFRDFEDNGLETWPDLHRSAIHFILLWINQEYEVCFFSPFMMSAKNAFDHYHDTTEKLTNGAGQTVMIALADEIAKAHTRLQENLRSALFYDNDLCKTFENFPVNDRIIPFGISESSVRKTSNEEEFLQGLILSDLFQLMAVTGAEESKAAKAVRLLSPFVSPVLSPRQLNDLVCTHLPLATRWLEKLGVETEDDYLQLLGKNTSKEDRILIVSLLSLYAFEQKRAAASESETDLSLPSTKDDDQYSDRPSSDSISTDSRAAGTTDKDSLEAVKKVQKLQNRIRMLETELEQAKGSAQKAFRDGCHSADKELKEVKLQNQKLSEHNQKLEENMKELYQLRSALFEEQQKDNFRTSGPLSQNQLTKLSQLMDRYSVTFVGGHIDLLAQLQKLYPSIRCAPHHNFRSEMVANADYVFFFYRFMSHTTYERAMDLIRAGNISFSYIPVKNLEQTQRFLLDALLKFDLEQ